MWPSLLKGCVCRISTPSRPLMTHDLCPSTNYDVCPPSPDERRTWPSLVEELCVAFPITDPVSTRASLQDAPTGEVG